MTSDGNYWPDYVQIQLVPKFDPSVLKQVRNYFSGSKVIDNSDIFQYKFMVLPLRNNRYKTGILGMFAIRSRRKVATEKDFLEAVNKVIKAYAKFSSTPKYMTYN